MSGCTADGGSLKKGNCCSHADPIPASELLNPILIAMSDNFIRLASSSLLRQQAQVLTGNWVNQNCVHVPLGNWFISGHRGLAPPKQ